MLEDTARVLRSPDVPDADKRGIVGKVVESVLPEKFGTRATSQYGARVIFVPGASGGRWIPPRNFTVVFVLLPHVIGRVADNDRDGALLALADALRVLLAEHRQLLRLGQVQRVGEADAVEGLILAHDLVVGVFDVQRGDVVRQQHDLVGEQLVLVLVAQGHRGRLPDAAQEVDQEVARAGAGVQNDDALIGPGTCRTRFAGRVPRWRT